MKIYSNGEYMPVNGTGEIARQGLVNYSGDWRIAGAVRFNNFGYAVEYFTVEQVMTEQIKWQYDNGKQRVHLQDINHGTRRTWMSPTHRVIL